MRAIQRIETLFKRRPSLSGAPVIFGNALPKSGSKLLRQILQGFSRIGPFSESSLSPIRSITIDGRSRSSAEILADLSRLGLGETSLGYLWATPENLARLCRKDWAVFQLLRDPRDMLVSQVYYASELYEGHALHDYYNHLPDFSARLQVAIRGIHQDGLEMAGVAERYGRVSGFLSCPEIITVRFEDLIQARETTLGAMLDRLEAAGYHPEIDRETALRRLQESIDPAKSPTFRKGRIGDWQDHFTQADRTLFKQVTGDLLIRLGYEENHDW
jgi:Sulfotransferase domain